VDATSSFFHAKSKTPQRISYESEGSLLVIGGLATPHGKQEAVGP